MNTGIFLKKHRLNKPELRNKGTKENSSIIKPRTYHLINKYFVQKKQYKTIKGLITERLTRLILLGTTVPKIEEEISYIAR